MVNKVIVTGGLGYIGSHTAVELSNTFQVVIVDDLSNSSIDVLDGISKISNTTPIFEKLDLKNKENVEKLFDRHSDAVGLIHFAAYKAVGESVENPLKYYENNLSCLIYLLQEINNLNHSFNFIFSSSATVYGQAKKLPITEKETIKKAESPYGNTKQISEEILFDYCKVNPKINVISLRYFNPIGAHDSCEIGELPIGVPQNLVPFITQTAAGIHEKVTVFGNDYNTPDGTCIRDYIHVTDLAKAHIVAIENLTQQNSKSNYNIYNIGTGNGTSVLEMIKSFIKVTGLELNYIIGPRRKGDVESAYADNSKAMKELNWKAENSIEDAILSAWNWEKKIRSL
tara:strand:- start:596 stop:1621 length:1026 start_codon:yes stop_codon:yes gene_type:complete